MEQTARHISNYFAATSLIARWDLKTESGVSCVCRFLIFLCVYQGVVSGILLVTSNKFFFDPCKTHPLVKENGCEEYVVSCSVDSLASVSFYSDITHIHFSTSQQRLVLFYTDMHTPEFSWER